MSNIKVAAVPAHIPPDHVLHDDPWRGGGASPHEWMQRVSAQGGLRFSPYHPLAHGAPGAWVALGAREMRAVLLDHKNFISRGATGVTAILGDDLVLAPLESDAPDHQRLRGILQPLFQPGAILAYREKIVTLAEELVSRVAADGRCEFIESYAIELPTRIFLDMVGLPAAGLPQFLEWEEIAMGRKSPERALEAWSNIRTYLAEAIDRRRAEPGEDMLTHIVQQTAAQNVNPDKEALGMAMILFVAGLDTVVTALGWIFRYLAENPAAQRRLREDPEHIPAAVEELLRAFSFTTVLRIAARDVEIFGVKIRAGEAVVCPTAMGSRDPHDYAEPGFVDLDRGAKRHLAFGFGQHICIGMHLARLELVTSLQTWLAAVPEFRLSDDYTPTCHGGVSLGMDELELRW